MRCITSTDLYLLRAPTKLVAYAIKLAVYVIEVLQGVNQSLLNQLSCASIAGVSCDMASFLHAVPSHCVTDRSAQR